MRLLVLRASIVITAMVASSAVAAPSCPINYGPHADAKPNKLYLYFPTADDPTFRNVDPPASLGLPPFITSSSPLHRFDTADLPDYHGTVTELRNAISDVVAREIYCEFNVQVIQTTTVPPNTEPRRNTVGIGTDANVVMRRRGDDRLERRLGEPGQALQRIGDPLLLRGQLRVVGEILEAAAAAGGVVAARRFDSAVGRRRSPRS